MRYVSTFGRPACLNALVLAFLSSSTFGEPLETVQVVHHLTDHPLFFLSEVFPVAQKGVSNTALESTGILNLKWRIPSGRSSPDSDSFALLQLQLVKQPESEDDLFSQWQQKASLNLFYLRNYQCNASGECTFIFEISGQGEQQLPLKGWQFQSIHSSLNLMGKNLQSKQAWIEISEEIPRNNLPTMLLFPDEHSSLDETSLLSANSNWEDDSDQNPKPPRPGSPGRSFYFEWQSWQRSSFFVPPTQGEETGGVMLLFWNGQTFQEIKVSLELYLQLRNLGAHRQPFIAWLLASRQFDAVLQYIAAQEEFIQLTELLPPSTPFLTIVKTLGSVWGRIRNTLAAIIVPDYLIIRERTSQYHLDPDELRDKQQLSITENHAEDDWITPPPPDEKQQSINVQVPGILLYAPGGGNSKQQSFSPQDKTSKKKGSTPLWQQGAVGGDGAGGDDPRKPPTWSKELASIVVLQYSTNHPHFDQLSDVCLRLFHFLRYSLLAKTQDNSADVLLDLSQTFDSDGNPIIRLLDDLYNRIYGNAPGSWGGNRLKDFKKMAKKLGDRGDYLSDSALIDAIYKFINQVPDQKIAIFMTSIFDKHNIAKQPDSNTAYKMSIQSAIDERQSSIQSRKVSNQRGFTLVGDRKQTYSSTRSLTLHDDEQERPNRYSQPLGWSGYSSSLSQADFPEWPQSLQQHSSRRPIPMARIHGHQVTASVPDGMPQSPPHTQTSMLDIYSSFFLNQDLSTGNIEHFIALLTDILHSDAIRQVALGNTESYEEVIRRFVSALIRVRSEELNGLSFDETKPRESIERMLKTFYYTQMHYYPSSFAFLDKLKQVLTNIPGAWDHILKNYGSTNL